MVKRTDRRREMERLLARRKREGMSLRCLSEETGIPMGTLSWWSHGLREEKDEKMPGFREVRVVEDAREVGRPASQSGSVRLELSEGVVAEFEGELAEQVTGAIVERLRRWS